MFYVMLNTGLRIGEVAGLRWGDVDFSKKMIHIEHSLTVSYVDGVKKQELNTPKTQNSYRSIPFIGCVEEMLKSQKKKQELLRKKLGKRYRAEGELEDVVFCTSMGSPVNRYIAEREINKIVEEINQVEADNAKREGRSKVEFAKVYPHALRHTFCTKCFKRGIAPKVTQNLMGHSHYSTTMDIYTHVSKDMYNEELKKFNMAEEL